SQPLILGLSLWIRSAAEMPSAALIVFRMPPRKVLTFFLEGLMSSFPLGYLRTFCPRKSNPDANRFPAYPPCQLPLYCFLGDEPDTPPRPPFRRRAAHEGDDPLTLARVQHPALAGTWLLVQRRFQPLLRVAPGNRPHGFGRHAHVVGHLRRRLSLVQLAQDRSSAQHPRRLPPFVQHPGDLLPLLLPQMNMHPMVALHVHTLRSIRSLHEYLNGYISMWSQP